MLSHSSVPIFINCRDRVSDLRRLVGWLEDAGYERIVLLDNDSTYEPLLEYLELCPHEVVHFGQNFGSKSLWRAGMVPGERFVFTDPDLLPVEDCPVDVVDVLWEALDVRPGWKKAAVGLYLEDTPAFQSLEWERKLVTPGSGWCEDLGRVRGARLFGSHVDTTFAVYQPHHAWTDLMGLRLGFPYQMRHLPWYRLDAPTEEERYYLERAVKGPAGSSWAEGKQ